MIFVSKKRRLRLVLKPTAYVLDAYGQKVMIPGETVEFINGRFETEDPELIHTMLSNKFKNSQFTAVENESEWYETHPEFKHAPIQMVSGAMATVNTAAGNTVPIQPSAVAATQGPLRETQRKETPVVDLEKMLDEKINAKLNPLLDKIDTLLGMEKPAPEVKAKRVFTCPVPGCGQTFRSGIEVGEHKRSAHSAPSEE